MPKSKQFSFHPKTTILRMHSKSQVKFLIIRVESEFINAIDSTQHQNVQEFHLRSYICYEILIAFVSHKYRWENSIPNIGLVENFIVHPLPHFKCEYKYNNLVIYLLVNYIFKQMIIWTNWENHIYVTA